MTQTIIFYPSGCYGTFMEWVLNYVENPKLELPFQKSGNSHSFSGNHFYPQEELFDTLANGTRHRFSRIHPGFLDSPFEPKKMFINDYGDVLQEEVDFLTKHFDKIITLTYTQKSLLWFENNSLDKILMTQEDMNAIVSNYNYPESHFECVMQSDPILRIKAQIKREVDYKYSPLTVDNLLGWGKTDIDDFNISELRELLSLYWFTRNSGEIAAWAKIKDNNNVLKITIDDIKENFVETMIKIADYANLTFDKNSLVDNLKNLYPTWANLQKQIDKDEICNRIVNSLRNKEYYDWSSIPLSIIDEAWIQHKLFNNGIGIKCYNLEIFPTNTTDFIPLLENI